MKNKHSRLNAIRVIIAGERIGSQDELLKRLLALGFDLTQATLSRDLKELEVSKEIMANGENIYILPDSPLHPQKGIPYGIQMNGGVVAIGFSANMAILKTRVGYAKGIAGDIDGCHFESVLGTVAGDDTILLVIKEGYTKRDVLVQLERIIPEIKTLELL